jgi:hypothetical protein
VGRKRTSKRDTAACSRAAAVGLLSLFESGSSVIAGIGIPKPRYKSKSVARKLVRFIKGRPSNGGSHPTVPARQVRHPCDAFVWWTLLRAATGARFALRSGAAVLILSLRARRRSALIRVCQPSPVSRQAFTTSSSGRSVIAVLPLVGFQFCPSVPRVRTVAGDCASANVSFPELKWPRLQHIQQ